MKNNPIPNVWKITKNVIRDFWQELKVRNASAIMALIVALVIIYWYAFPFAHMEGAVGILLMYALGMTFYTRNLKAQIKELKEEPINTLL